MSTKFGDTDTYPRLHMTAAWFISTQSHSHWSIAFVWLLCILRWIRPDSFKMRAYASSHLTYPLKLFKIKDSFVLHAPMLLYITWNKRFRSASWVTLLSYSAARNVNMVLKFEVTCFGLSNKAIKRVIFAFQTAVTCSNQTNIKFDHFLKWLGLLCAVI